MDPVGNLDKKLWDQVVAVNLTAPYMISKLAVQHMLEKQIKGSIVNIGSIAAIRGFAAGLCSVSFHLIVVVDPLQECLY